MYLTKHDMNLCFKPNIQTYSYARAKRLVFREEELYAYTLSEKNIKEHRH